MHGFFNTARPTEDFRERQTALQGGCKHVSICTCFFIPVFDSFSATGWAIKTVQICSNLFARYRYVYLRWLRIADLLVCLQTIILRSTMVWLTLLSAHLEFITNAALDHLVDTFPWRYPDTNGYIRFTAVATKFSMYREVQLHSCIY